MRQRAFRHPVQRTGVFADGQGHLLNEGQATTLEGLDVSALSALYFVQGQTYAL